MLKRSFHAICGSLMVLVAAGLGLIGGGFWGVVSGGIFGLCIALIVFVVIPE